MFKGIMGGPREWIMKAMVENFAHLFETHHIIPNFNAPASMGRSQPPFLSSMILNTYETLTRSTALTDSLRRLTAKVFYNSNADKEWLLKMILVAKKEYSYVWMDPQDVYHHRVAKFNLNRYGDRDLGYDHSSELESGWDFTSRFYNRASNFLPIDLNMYMYKYEKDFMTAAHILGDQVEKRLWRKQARKRATTIQKLMWDKKKGFFFDYNYLSNRRSGFLSLAGFTPLWAGFASKSQAKKMVRKLKKFETDFGLAITAKESLAPLVNLSSIPSRYRHTIDAILTPKQWDYPNIWPPLEYLTVIGLLQYGFVEDAKRIMEKSIKAHTKIFKKHRTLFERINGITGEKPKDFHYPTQAGFGWTNAIFYRYVKLLEAIEEKTLYAKPKSKIPPYELAVLH